MVTAYDIAPDCLVYQNGACYVPAETHNQVNGPGFKSNYGISFQLQSTTIAGFNWVSIVDNQQRVASIGSRDVILYHVM